MQLKSKKWFTSIYFLQIFKNLAENHLKENNFH